MKLDAIPLLGAAPARSGAPSLTIADGADFAARLTLGQLITGRVLRVYDQRRALVDFGGEPRVVDSAVPLRADEVFTGRVVGLGERVELQKLGADGAAAPPPAAAPKPPAAGRAAGALEALFERYAADVAPARLEAIAAWAQRQPLLEPAALAALVLTKLGLPLRPEWLKPLQARLAAGSLEPDPAAAAARLRLEAHPAGVTEPVSADAAAALLPAALAQRLHAGAQPERAAGRRREPVAALAQDPAGPRAKRRETDASGRDAGADPSPWLLNAQTGGSVGHRVGTLPLVVDDRLVELQVALFDEYPGRDGDGDGALRHRRIVLSIATPALGRVDVRAGVAGAHLRAELATHDADATAFLSRHSAALAADLTALGWQVDGLAYATQFEARPGAPLSSVVEHLLSPGSVSRIV